MSKYSEYLKQRKDNDLAFFFGDIEKQTNKYFTFKRVKSNDEFILITCDVKWIKGSPALIVGSNKAVFLKDWAVRNVHNYYLGMNGYAVKLNRKYFKVYTFQNAFDDYEDTEDWDFDSLLNLAAEQDKVNMKIAVGLMG